MFKTKTLLFGLVFVPIVGPLFSLMTAAPVLAQCRDNEVQVSVNPGEARQTTDQDGNTIYCMQSGTTVDDNAIFIYLRSIIQFLASGVGLVIAFMIVVSGIEYVTSSGNPQRIEHAKKRLTESIEALLLFIFMVVILNFVIPGGIIST